MFFSDQSLAKYAVKHKIKQCEKLDYCESKCNDDTHLAYGIEIFGRLHTITVFRLAKILHAYGDGYAQQGQDVKNLDEGVDAKQINLAYAFYHLGQRYQD